MQGAQQAVGAWKVFIMQPIVGYSIGQNGQGPRKGPWCAVPTSKPDKFSNWTKFKVGFTSKKLLIVLLKEVAIPTIHRSPKVSV